MILWFYNQASVDIPVTPTPLCNMPTYIPCLSWLNFQFEELEEPVKASTTNVPWSSEAAGSRARCSGGEETKLELLQCQQLPKLSQMSKEKCHLSHPEGRGEFSGCECLIKGPQWDWLSAQWSQWKALPWTSVGCGWDTVFIDHYACNWFIWMPCVLKQYKRAERSENK